jgi:hypothetical protein
MKVLGVTTVNAFGQLNRRLSQTSVRRVGSSSRRDLILRFLVERELFAQEEILGGKRGFGSQAEGQKAEQIDKGVQPKQAGFHHGPMPLGFESHLFKFGRSLAPFPVRRVILAEDTSQNSRLLTAFGVFGSYWARR